MEKEQLVAIIKEWVKNDNEIRVLQKQQKLRKEENKQITNKLLDVMKKNDIDCFDIKDGKVLYKKQNIKKAISKAYLIKQLSTFFEGNESKAEELKTYILENREVQVKEAIKFKEIALSPPPT